MRNRDCNVRGKRSSHRVSNEANAIGTKRIDDLDDVIAHGSSCVVLPFGGSLGKAVAFEVYCHGTETGVSKWCDGLVENPRAARPSVKQQNDGRVLITCFDYADLDPGRELEKMRPKITPAGRKHLRGRQPSWKQHDYFLR
jgi:hypothetical protein